MAGIVWDDQRTPTMVFGEFYNDIVSNVGGRVTKVVNRVVKEELDSAKRNPPWTPRTGKAQEGLTSIVDKTDKNTWEVTIFFDPDIVKAWRPRAPSSDSDGYYRYGASLEMLHQGRFQIIVPTLEKIFVKIVNELTRIVNSPRRRDA